MIYSVISTMGGGKTLFATLYAIQYSKLNPSAPIYANYRLKLLNLVYTPFGFLSFSELEQSERALIIFDDFLAIKSQLSGLLQIIANASRKLSLDIILTCQYYTMIPKSVRTLSQIVEVSYRKKSDILFIAFKHEISEQEIKWETFYVTNAVTQAKDYYDTKEIVPFASESKIVEEIIRMSKNEEDIRKNIEIYTQSNSKRLRIENLIYQKINSK